MKARPKARPSRRALSKKEIEELSRALVQLHQLFETRGARRPRRVVTTEDVLHRLSHLLLLHIRRTSYASERDDWSARLARLLADLCVDLVRTLHVRFTRSKSRGRARGAA